MPMTVLADVHMAAEVTTVTATVMQTTSITSSSAVSGALEVAVTVQRMGRKKLLST